MPLKVVDPHDRQFGRKRQSLGEVNPYHERASQTRTAGNRDAIQVSKTHVRLLQGFVNYRVNRLDVLARSQFRVHTAKLGMQIHLAGNHTALDHPAILNDCGSGLIAGALNS